MWAPLRSVFLHTIGTDQFPCILYGGPLRLVSSLTICASPPPRSDLFFCILYGGRPFSSLTIWGPPQVSFFTYYIGPTSDQFFAYYMGATSDQFPCIQYSVPLRSVLSLTIWGPLRSVFCLLYRAISR